MDSAIENQINSETIKNELNENSNHLGLSKRKLKKKLKKIKKKNKPKLIIPSKK